MRLRAVAAGLLVLAVMVLSLAIATAGAQAAGAAQPPFINSGFADRPVEPTRFSPNLSETPPEALMKSPANNYVRSIRWSSWGGNEAIGSGQVSLLHGTFSSPEEIYGPGETSPVTVRLGGLSQCAGVPVYTTYSLELAPGAQQPNGWPRGQTGTFPCNIESASERWPSRYHETACDYYGYKGLQPPMLPPLDTAPEFFKAPRFSPALPFHQPTLSFCKLRAKRWGSPKATLAGFGKTFFEAGKFERGHIWPVKLELERPIWCPAAAAETGRGATTAAITYGELKLTVYGTGSAWESGDPPGSSGHRGLTPHIYRERINPKPEKCLLGIEDSDPAYNPGGSAESG